MNDANEKCLQEVLADIYEKLAITEEQFQASLHFHCNKDSKRDKINMISKSSNHAIF